VFRVYGCLGFRVVKVLSGLGTFRSLGFKVVSGVFGLGLFRVFRV